jgi:hypothetical protein
MLYTTHILPTLSHFYVKSYPIAHRKLGQTTFQRTTSQLNMLVLVISVHIARG